MKTQQSSFTSRLARRVHLACGVVAVVVTTLAAAAAEGPPQLLNYQGYLTDSDGTALNSSAPGTHNMTFSIYDGGGSSAEKLWTEEQPAVSVSKGVFNVLLGAGNEVQGETGKHEPLSSVFRGTDADERYIGIAVAGINDGAELSPRLRLVTSPFAFLASRALEANKLVGSDNADLFAISADGDASVSKKLVVQNATTAYPLKVENNNGYVEIGAGNAVYAHFQTDRPKFHFNQPVEFEESIDVRGRGSRFHNTAQFDNTVSLTSATEATLSSSSALVIGSSSGESLAFDANEIQARNAGDTNVLSLQPHGGTVEIGGGGTPGDARLHILATGQKNVAVADNDDDHFSGANVSLLPAIRIEGNMSGNRTKWDIGIRNGGTQGTQFFEIAKDNTNGRDLRAYLHADSPGWKVPSDRRLKTDIVDVGGVLDKLAGISPVSYRMKSADAEAKKEIGVIAQDVHAVFPELISRFDGVHMGLSYERLAPLAIGGINELRKESQKADTALQGRVDALTEENAALRGTVDALLQRLQRLEGRLTK